MRCRMYESQFWKLKGATQLLYFKPTPREGLDTTPTRCIRCWQPSSKVQAGQRPDFRENRCLGCSTCLASFPSLAKANAVLWAEGRRVIDRTQKGAYRTDLEPRPTCTPPGSQHASTLSREVNTLLPWPTCIHLGWKPPPEGIKVHRLPLETKPLAGRVPS